VQATLSAYTKAATVASVVLALEHNEVEEHNANVAESVLDLIRALWTRQSTLSTSSPTRHELLQRITAFITVNLAPPDLTQATIARAHSISLRSLYPLFEREAVSVCQSIREQRLDRRRRDLLDPTCRHEQINAIARPWSFTSPELFSRQFGEAYGCHSPAFDHPELPPLAPAAARRGPAPGSPGGRPSPPPPRGSSCRRSSYTAEQVRTEWN
jgi:AraC-like DNA-binding protein